MVPLHEFTKSIDSEAQEPWDYCKSEGLIQKFKVNMDELTERE